MKKQVSLGLKCLSILLFSITSVALSAHNIQLLLDPINSAQQNSLFNLSIVNQSAYPGQLTLQATLQSRRGKKLMVERTTVNINANEIKSLRGSNVEAQTLYKDAAFSRLYQQGVGLPPMNYVLCVQVQAIGDRSIRSEECIEYNATDFVNLLPLYPSEEGEIFESRPVFSWADFSGMEGYTYDFKLVGLDQDENANAALRRKMPLVHINNLQTNQLLYPADAQPLENNKSYAWQLTLNYQGEKVISSEPWFFRYKEQDSLIEIPRNLSYVDITELEDGATLFAVGEFKFKYPSEEETEIQAKLFEHYKKSGKNKKVELTDNSFEVERGVNKFELDLKEQVYLKHLKEYRIQLETKDGKNYRFFIKYVNPDYIK